MEIASPPESAAPALRAARPRIPQTPRKSLIAGISLRICASPDR